MQAVASSQGLFAYDRFTAADYNLTARTPDGIRFGLGIEVVQRASAAASRPRWPTTAIDKAAMAKNPAGIEPGKYTVDPGAGRARRSARLHVVLGRCPAGRRGSELLFEKGRREPRRRADRRRQGPHLLGSGASARAEHLLRQRGASDREERLGGERRAEGSLLFAVLGRQDGKEADRGSRQRHHGGRQRDDGRSHRRHRARRPRHALLVHQAPRSADHPRDRADARRAVSDRKR